MSSDLRRITHSVQQKPRQDVWTAKVATGADDATDPIHVIIHDFDPHRRWGPCRWTPRGTALPQVGDDALVIFDNRRTPWVVCWWPA